MELVGPESAATSADERAGGQDADEDPDPEVPLYVPVRLCSAGHEQLCLARTPLGERTAIGFTGQARLTSVFGRRQRWVRLAEPALRALAEPLGVTVVTVDPRHLAGPVRVTAPVPARSGRPWTATAQPCARRSMEMSEAMSL